MIYQSDKAYPVPRVERVNRNYALLLLENYAGSISEDTAVHQYLYEYFMTNNEYQDFANAILMVSKVEMRHMKLLGETIKLLGVMPVYGTVSDDKYVSWCSSNVGYNNDIESMILRNIKYEEEAIRRYKRNYMLINDKYVRELIDRIIEDELIHIEVFNYFYDNLVKK